MKFDYHIFRSRRILHKLAISVMCLLLALALSLYLAIPAYSMQSVRDCDNNAVIHCGALTTDELKQKYGNQKDVRALFNYFGISSEDMSQIGTTAVEGKVTKAGRVVVDGKTVATDAMTAGRQKMPGSTAVISGGTQFYTRPPSVSFASQSLPAFVVMKDGQFDYAIIASCGNPVRATAKKPVTFQQPAPQPTPQPQVQAPPAPTAVAVASTTVVVQQQQQQQTQPAPQPTPIAAAPVQLPKTGLENTFVLAMLATAGGAVAHLLYSRTRRKLHSRND